MRPPAEDSSARLLIVDDQEVNVRLLEHTLRRAGYVEVMSTVDPREVVALHLANPFDLILLDLQMPRMDGFAVMTELQKTPEATPVAILVISADASQSDGALRAGADSFLGKPFRLPEVVARVRSMLRKAGFNEAVPLVAPVP